jgi:spore coat polysaccharide biosynthesis protein SpsF (cytidylyltransferase family)
MKGNKVVAIVQARLGSRRFPRKILAEIAGKPSLEHVLRRVKLANRVDEVILGTPYTEDDAEVDAIADRLAVDNVSVNDTEEDDVLARYASIAQDAGADIVVRITADCPLIDPEIIDTAVEAFNELEVDYLSTSSDYPLGFSVEVFSNEALFTAHLVSTDPYEREHVTPWIIQEAQFFNAELLTPDGVNLSGYRLTLDYPEDLELIREVYERYPSESYDVEPEPTLASAIEYINERRVNRGYA